MKTVEKQVSLEVSDIPFEYTKPFTQFRKCDLDMESVSCWWKRVYDGPR